MVRPLKPADLYQLQSVGDVALSPDGATVVFTIAWPDQETDENRSRLWQVPTEGGEATLLLDGHRDARPTFSPDGSKIAFLRAEPASPAHPAVLDLASGDVTPIDALVDGVADLRWLNNERLVALAPRRPAEHEGLSDDEIKRLPRVLDSLNYRFNGRGWTHDRKRQIAVVNVADSSIDWLRSDTHDLPQVDCAGAAPAPDASCLIAILPDPDTDLTGGTSVWLLPLDGTASVRLTAPGGSWSAVGWTSDGRPFATGHLDNSVTSFDHPHLLDPSGDLTPQRLGADDVNCTALLGGFALPAAVDGALVLPGIRGGTISIDRYDLATGAVTVVAPVRGMAGSFAAAVDGSRIVASVSTPTRPAELWDLTPMASGQPPVVLVSLNDELLAELDLVEPEVVTLSTQGPGPTDNAEVETFVFHPPASAPNTGERRPALLYVHGGPMSIYGLNFFDEFQLAAAAGYVVAGSNPRGSDGYGIEFGRAVIGDMGGPDWIDVAAVADYLESLESVDPNRVGMGGGSYGGFMTSWAIGHTNRFAAALVERCVSNWESFIGTSDIGSWFGPRCCGATIESDVDSIRRQSPISYAKNNTTPTLILHSEEDWRCPPEQAEQLFAAYRRAGVDTTFIRIPGENHELTRGGKPRHRVERFELVHDFFADHLGGGRFPA